MNATCQRCANAGITTPATHRVAFRSGLGWTESVNACTPCLGVLVDVARTPAKVDPIDQRPAWLQRDLRKDLTPA